MKKLENFDNFTTVKLGDLENNWSPEYYNFKKMGMYPYVKKGGILVKVDTKKSIPKDAIYMLPENVDEYNELAGQLIEIKSKQDEIINKSYEMNKVRSRTIKENNKITLDDYIENIIINLNKRFELTNDQIDEIISYYHDDIIYAFKENGGYIEPSDLINSWVVNKKLKWKK